MYNGLNNGAVGNLNVFWAKLNPYKNCVRMSAFLAKHGWGVQGKLGISKLLQPTDLPQLKMKTVATYRPRGILSGFLVVQSDVVFIPPGKSPQPLRMRLKPLHGSILSAYQDGTDLVLEDVLVWKGVSVWEQGFETRWKCMQEFVESWRPDEALQGCGIRLARYISLAELQEPEERQVIEFVPLGPRMKRLVWIPEEEVKTTTWIAKRERHVGPDVFSLWSMDGEKQPNLALVRTLAVSRLLQTHLVDEFKVKGIWNKRFSVWEIVGIA
jgi:hypothetical protein